MSKQKQTHDPLNVDEALNTSEAFLLKYKNLFIGVVVAIVVIVCGVVGYNHFIGEPNELKASEALFKGEQYFGNNEFELALNGDSIYGLPENCRRVQRYRCRKPCQRLLRTLLCATGQVRRSNNLSRQVQCRRLHGSTCYHRHHGQLLCTNGTIG